MRKEKFLIHLVAASLIMIVMWTLLYLASYAYSRFISPISFHGANVMIPDHTESPSTVHVCRGIRVDRPVILSVSRSIVKADGDNKIKMYDIGSTIVARKESNIYQCRTIQIPDCIEEGKWVLKTSVTWKDWPNWEHIIEAPDVPFTVTETNCK